MSSHNVSERFKCKNSSVNTFYTGCSKSPSTPTQKNVYVLKTELRTLEETTNSHPSKGLRGLVQTQSYNRNIYFLIQHIIYVLWTLKWNFFSYQDVYINQYSELSKEDVSHL